MVAPAERGIWRETSTAPKIYTSDTFPYQDLTAKPLILEVNAGNTPIGVSWAARHAGHAVVSQDIVVPNLYKESLSNFYYFVGDPLKIDFTTIDALVSMFPYPHDPETLRWLPQLIQRALQQNPSTYIGVVSEHYSGNRLPGALANILSDNGWDVHIAHVNINYVSHMFGQTLYGEDFEQYLSQVSIIEVNPERRSTFICR